MKKSNILGKKKKKDVPIHSCMSLLSSPTHEYYHFDHQILVQSAR